MGRNQHKVLVLSVLLTWVVFSLYLMSSQFRVATLNVNGARDMRKRALLYELVKMKGIDVMMIQETHSDAGNEADWKAEWEGEVCLSSLTSVSGGVAILFSRSFVPVSYEVQRKVEGRLMVVKAKFEHHTFVFINVYAPVIGVSRAALLHVLNETLMDCSSNDFLFLGGDFNCTQNDHLDRNHPEPHMESQRLLNKLIETNDLVDVWRRLHDTKRQYTWAHVRENVISLARLDRFYCFTHHFGVFKMCHMLPVGFTDHSLVLSDVFVASVKPRSAYWHFNSTLLCDSNFKEAVKFFWNSFRDEKQNFKSLRLWWDCGKVKIKQLCQQYTLNVTRDITRSMSDLEIEMVELQNAVESTGDRGHFEVLKSKKNMLEDLLGIRAQGALVRSRFQSANLMDAPSSFFFGLEKRSGQSRFVHTLRSADGHELTETAEIRREAVSFYSGLYRSEYRENEQLFTSLCDGLPKIAAEENPDLGEPLTMRELCTALQSMKEGKAPGIDGLTVDFYKAFWEELGEDFLSVVNESFKEKTLPYSCRRAVITLLPKKGDLQDIKNWRPVSLLCTDYKILSKALANRLREVLEQVIHQDQTYCVPGRSIVDNVSLIRDVLDVSSSLGLDVGFISLDQEKAFDRVEHLYLWKIMERFGLNPGLIAMIKVLYQDIESVLKINGGLSAPFTVSRGVRQGCSLSGILYAVSIEPLLHRIRSDVHGLILPGFKKAHVLSAYADDVLVLVTNQKEVGFLWESVNDFGLLTNAKVNWKKSEALAVGRWPGGLPSLPGGLVWKKGGIKYLGIYLGDEMTEKKNWEGLIEKVQGRLNKWKWLLPKMSFRGRTLVINNLVASSLWHRLCCMEPPGGLIKKLQAILVDFFWDRLHWVPQAVLFLPKEEGGQGLIHLESRMAAFRVQFTQRFLTTSGDFLVWKDVASVILRRVSGFGFDAALFLMDGKGLNLSKLSPFYKGVFKAWNLFKVKVLEPAASLYWLLEEPLVGGARMDIQDSSTPSLTHTLCTTGLTTLRRLVDAAGPGLMDVHAVAALMGLKSVRHMEYILKRWSERLSVEDFELLRIYWEGEENPDAEDPFPDLELYIDFDGCSGLLLDATNENGVDLYTVGGKLLYKCCVKALNASKLHGREDSVWRNKLNVTCDHRPGWGVLYKHPSKKRTGDLQWRILHGAIAVNALVSVMNPTVSDKCPFCGSVETVFHCFLECERCKVLFDVLETLFLSFKEEWSAAAFIFGAGYRRSDAVKWQLLNFLLGEAKMALYLTRRNKIKNGVMQDVVSVFIALVRARVRIDFRFYKGMKNLSTFVKQWCYNEVICSVMEEELMFSVVFM